MANKRSLLASKAIALICCIVMIVSIACVPKAPKERPASLTILPTSAKAGSVIILSGTQFAPGEEVEIIMTVGNVHHSLGTEKADTVIANDKGAFEVTSGIPVKTPPGTYKVTASGNKGSIGAFTIKVIQ